MLSLLSVAWLLLRQQQQLFNVSISLQQKRSVLQQTPARHSLCISCDLQVLLLLLRTPAAAAAAVAAVSF